MSELVAVANSLRQYNYVARNEAELQDAIASALTMQGHEFRREVELSKSDRIDFMAGSVGVEVKVGGSRSALIRQLHRYAQHDEVESLLVVTTLHKLTALGESLNGKTIKVIRVGGFL